MEEVQGCLWGFQIQWLKTSRREPCVVILSLVITLDPAYNKFGYNEHPAATSK